jgi:hypothetical protein
MMPLLQKQQVVYLLENWYQSLTDLSYFQVEHINPRYESLRFPPLWGNLYRLSSAIRGMQAAVLNDKGNFIAAKAFYFESLPQTNKDLQQKLPSFEKVEEVRKCWKMAQSQYNLYSISSNFENSEYGKCSMRVHYVTYASKRTEGLEYLLKSATYSGISMMVSEFYGLLLRILNVVLLYRF